ncbi:ribosomal RNA large subunit methyltransferase J, putative [Eimeria brunetti]|uniref:rRNA methyltransferase 2, mitochondrial n=1 Tax=Eimeria brunetti TaxID=51314 RepID=U6LIB2_9EIME|nr:ribosomal RNA large subunit methyltransferase J, putative [Eimeria brunetti]
MCASRPRDRSVGDAEDSFLGDAAGPMLAIPARRPPQFRLLKKRERTVNRAYGGTRCHSCVREKVLRAFLVEEQKCVKQVLQVKERQKRDEVKTESKKGKKRSTNMVRGAGGLLPGLATVSMQYSSAAIPRLCPRHTRLFERIGTFLQSSTGVRSLASAIPAIRNHRSQHSSEWIRRHISDPYIQRAQECEYRSRSAFKLKQLDDEYLFLRKDRVVLDLGCYPGGWCQIAAKRCLLQGHEVNDQPGGGAAMPSTSRIIGVDVVKMDPIENVQFIQGRVGDAKTVHAVLQALGDRKADVVLSDMAPSCTGIRHDDHFNSVELCLYAADLMEQVLCLGGTFVVKIFMGSELGNYKTYLKSRFNRVASAKPRACRPESREMYFVCTGFKGRDKMSHEVQIKGSFSAKEGYA